MDHMKKSLVVGLLLITVLLTSVLSLALYQSHAAGVPGGVNQNCSLIVPPNLFTAQGLATPYQLTATDPAQGPCHESNIRQSVFVQAAVINTDTGQLSVYNPLVIDKGTQAAVNPVVPALPANNVVGIWIGGNDNNTVLQGAARQCINGLPGSIFGQMAFCNAVKFFQAANMAIRAGKLTPPPLGLANDDMACPTVRDFSVVDQDQSDNTTTTYLSTGAGQIAQNTAANRAQFPTAALLGNGSDNGLLDAHIDPAIGCTPWKVTDLADPGTQATALPLDELQAAAFQQAPIALVPLGDPMTQINGQSSLVKTDLYRINVDQHPAFSVAGASTTTYCMNLRNGAKRLALDAKMTNAATTPDVAVGNTLFTFLAARYVGAYTQLKCQGLTGSPDPVVITAMVNGAATQAQINGVNPLA